MQQPAKQTGIFHKKHSLINTVILMMVIGLLLSSCKPKALTSPELQKYISKDKALCQTQEASGIKVETRYYPWQLLVKQELDGTPGSNQDTARIHKLEEKYKHQYYFKLSFSKDNKEVIRQLGSYGRYSEMLQVFSFSMGAYINATTEKKDTAATKDYAFEQDYGMSSANTLLVAFDKNSLQSGEAITVHIAEFGLGTGNLSYPFRRSDLESVPGLKYQ